MKLPFYKEGATGFAFEDHNIKIADVAKSTLLPEIRAFFEKTKPDYRDVKMNEHLFPSEMVAEWAATASNQGKAQLLELVKLINNRKIAYIRAV